MVSSALTPAPHSSASQNRSVSISNSRGRPWSVLSVGGTTDVNVRVCKGLLPHLRPTYLAAKRFVTNPNNARLKSNLLNPNNIIYGGSKKHTKTRLPRVFPHSPPVAKKPKCIAKQPMEVVQAQASKIHTRPSAVAALINSTLSSMSTGKKSIFPEPPQTPTIFTQLEMGKTNKDKMDTSCTVLSSNSSFSAFTASQATTEATQNVSDRPATTTLGAKPSSDTLTSDLRAPQSFAFSTTSSEPTANKTPFPFAGGSETAPTVSGFDVKQLESVTNPSQPVNIDKCAFGKTTSSPTCATTPAIFVSSTKTNESTRQFAPVASTPSPFPCFGTPSLRAEDCNPVTFAVSSHLPTANLNPQPSTEHKTLTSASSPISRFVTTAASPPAPNSSPLTTPCNTSSKSVLRAFYVVAGQLPSNVSASTKRFKLPVSVVLSQLVNSNVSTTDVSPVGEHSNSISRTSSSDETPKHTLSQYIPANMPAFSGFKVKQSDSEVPVVPVLVNSGKDSSQGTFISSRFETGENPTHTPTAFSGFSVKQPETDVASAQFTNGLTKSTLEPILSQHGTSSSVPIPSFSGFKATAADKPSVAVPPEAASSTVAGNGIPKSGSETPISQSLLASCTSLSPALVFSGSGTQQSESTSTTVKSLPSTAPFSVNSSTPTPSSASSDSFSAMSESQSVKVRSLFTANAPSATPDDTVFSARTASETKVGETVSDSFGPSTTSSTIDIFGANSSTFSGFGGQKSKHQAPSPFPLAVSEPISTSAFAGLGTKQSESSSVFAVLGSKDSEVVPKPFSSPGAFASESKVVSTIKATSGGLPLTLTERPVVLQADRNAKETTEVISSRFADKVVALGCVPRK